MHAHVMRSTVREGGRACSSNQKNKGHSTVRSMLSSKCVATSGSGDEVFAGVQAGVSQSADAVPVTSKETMIWLARSNIHDGNEPRLSLLYM